MKEKDRGSVPQRGRGFTVAPSPFNSVKLELGVILVAAIVLGVGIDRLISDPLLQMVALGGAGVVAALWLFWRTRMVVRSAGAAGQ